jgi:hypothetical protein
MPSHHQYKTNSAFLCGQKSTGSVQENTLQSHGGVGIEGNE